MSAWTALSSLPLISCTWTEPSGKSEPRGTHDIVIKEGRKGEGEERRRHVGDTGFALCLRSKVHFLKRKLKTKTVTRVLVSCSGSLPGIPPPPPLALGCHLP